MQSETFQCHYRKSNMIIIVSIPESLVVRGNNIKTRKTNLCISTYSISPEKEKNSLISRSDAPKETLLTFTVVVCKKNSVKTMIRLQRLKIFEKEFSIYNHLIPRKHTSFLVVIIIL